MPHFLSSPEFWVLVSFVIFFAVFGGKAWAALTGLLDSRADSIRTELAEAQRLRAEAEAMLADAEAARAAALAEAQDLLLRSHAEAARLTEAALLEAEATGQRRERLALERIAAAEKAAIAEVRQTAAEIATTAARQVIARGLGADQDAPLIDQAIAGLPAALKAA